MLFVLFLAIPTSVPCADAGEQADGRVNLWPVLHYDDPVLTAMWPISRFDFEKGHNQVFPFFWGDDYFIAFPEVWWFEDDKAILPFVWGDDYFVAFPLLWQCEGFDGVFPTFWWDDGMMVLPLFYYKKDKECSLFPLWLHSRIDGGRDTWILWPFYRNVETDKSDAFHLWPLYGDYKYEKKDKRYRFAFWPLCHDWRSEDRVLTLTPVWSTGARKGNEWKLLFPLYYSNANSVKDTSCLLTPLFGQTRTGEKARWFIFPLSSSAAWGEEEKDLWIAAPLSHFRWGGNRKQSHVLPIYYYDSKENIFLSPFYSRQSRDDRGFFNVMMFLSHYEYRSDGRRSFWLFPPLTQFSRGGEPGYGEGWLLSRHTSKQEIDGVGEVASRHTNILQWAEFARYYGDFKYRGPAGTTMMKGEWQRNGWWPLWEYNRFEEIENKHRRSDFSLGTFLYRSHLERDATAETGSARRRVLWKVIDYERNDDALSLDVFPGITWDSKDNGYSKCSFLWRMFRNERTEDGGRNLDILFIPLMRSAGSSS